MPTDGMRPVRVPCVKPPHSNFVPSTDRRHPGFKSRTQRVSAVTDGTLANRAKSEMRGILSLCAISMVLVAEALRRQASRPGCRHNSANGRLPKAMPTSASSTVGDTSGALCRGKRAPAAPTGTIPIAICETGQHWECLFCSACCKPSLTDGRAKFLIRKTDTPTRPT